MTTDTELIDWLERYRAQVLRRGLGWVCCGCVAATWREAVRMAMAVKRD